MSKRVLLVSALLYSSVLLASSAQAQKVTIQYWNINTENFGGPAVRDLIKAFQAKNPDITVEPRFQQNSYTGLLQNLQTSVAASDPPDVSQIGYLYTNYVHDNLPYVPVKDLVSKYQSAAYLRSYPKGVLTLGQSEGEQIGMPYSLSNTMIYFNADLFKKAGLSSAPTTWAAWKDAAKRIKDKTGKYGLYLNTLDDNWVTEALIASNGGSLLKCDSGTVKAGFDSLEAAEALQLWADMVRDGSALNALAAQGEQAFLAGEVAAIGATIAKRQNYQTTVKFALGGARFARFGTKPTRLPGGGNILVIFTKDPARQAAAWKFVQFLTSSEGFTQWTKGTGYAPPIRGLEKDERYLKGFVEQNPLQKIGIGQLSSTIPWTSFPGSNGLAASQALFKATQRALSGQASAKDALSSAAAEVNPLLKGEKCSK